MFKKFLNKIKKRSDDVIVATIAASGDPFEAYHWNQYEIPFSSDENKGILTNLTDGKILIIDPLGKCFLFNPATKTFATTVPDCPALDSIDGNGKVVPLPNSGALAIGKDNIYAVYNATSNLWTTYTLPLAGGMLVASHNTIRAYVLSTRIIFMVVVNNGDDTVKLGAWDYTIVTNTFVFYECPVVGHTADFASCITPDETAIYIVGEYNVASQLPGVTPVRKYDITTHTFTAKTTTMPATNVHEVAFIDNTSIMMVGGYFLSDTAFCPVRIYHTDTDTITTSTGIQTPVQLMSATAIKFMGINFYIGASFAYVEDQVPRSASDLRTVLYYIGGEWHVNSTMAPISNASTCVSDGVIYAITKSPEFTKGLQAFTTEPQDVTLTSSTWTELNDTFTGDLAGGALSNGMICVVADHDGTTTFRYFEPLTGVVSDPETLTHITHPKIISHPWELDDQITIYSGDTWTGFTKVRISGEDVVSSALVGPFQMNGQIMYNKMPDKNLIIIGWVTSASTMGMVVYDPTITEVSNVAAITGLVPRVGGAIFPSSDSVTIMGGFDPTNAMAPVTSIQVLTLSSMAVTTYASALVSRPHPVTYTQITAGDQTGQICIVGMATETATTGTFEIYNPVTHAVTTGAACPAIYGHQAYAFYSSVLGSYLYVFGGTKLVESSPVAQNLCYVYSFVLGTWTILDHNLVTAQSGHTLICDTKDCRMYSIGPLDAKFQYLGAVTRDFARVTHPTTAEIAGIIAHDLPDPPPEGPPPAVIAVIIAQDVTPVKRIASTKKPHEAGGVSRVRVKMSGKPGRL